MFKVWNPAHDIYVEDGKGNGDAVFCCITSAYEVARMVQATQGGRWTVVRA